MINYYLLALFIFVLLVAVIFLFDRLKRSRDRERDNTVKDREQRLFKLYQNLEEMINGLEEYIEESKKEFHVEVDLAQMRIHREGYLENAALNGASDYTSPILPPVLIRDAQDSARENDPNKNNEKTPKKRGRKKKQAIESTQTSVAQEDTQTIPQTGDAQLTANQLIETKQAAEQPIAVDTAIQSPIEAKPEAKTPAQTMHAFDQPAQAKRKKPQNKGAHANTPVQSDDSIKDENAEIKAPQLIIVKQKETGARQEKASANSPEAKVPVPQAKDRPAAKETHTKNAVAQAKDAKAPVPKPPAKVSKVQPPVNSAGQINNNQSGAKTAVAKTAGAKASAPKLKPDEARAQNKITQPARQPGKQNTPPAKKGGKVEDVRRLHRMGLSEDKIARELSMSQGEVNLILGMLNN